MNILIQFAQSLKFVREFSIFHTETEKQYGVPRMFCF